MLINGSPHERGTTYTALKKAAEMCIRDRKKAAKQGTLTAGPMNIYEVHLGSWKKREDSEDDQSNPFYNYREIAPELAAYAKDVYKRQI